LRVLGRALLEHRDDARLVMARALADEFGGEHALARARGAGEQHRVAGGNATAEHLVETLDAEREPIGGAARGRVLWPDDHPREHLESGARDADGVQPWN